MKTSNVKRFFEKIFKFVSKKDTFLWKRSLFLPTRQIPTSDAIHYYIVIYFMPIG